MVHHVNDTEEELNEMIEFISSLGDGVKKIQLLKYHSLGKMKYQWIEKNVWSLRNRMNCTENIY